MDIIESIDKQVKQNPIVLYMKGSAKFPMCGFSGKVVKILSACNVKFLDVNVLENDEIREGIKRYTDWPTIPQLYINGEFIGGCDIVSQMYETGELQQLLSSMKG